MEKEQEHFILFKVINLRLKKCYQILKSLLDVVIHLHQDMEQELQPLYLIIMNSENNGKMNYKKLLKE
jgi:hypothetical protein